jgi:eukaryotic-like serine/threonine-protein kinase
VSSCPSPEHLARLLEDALDPPERAQVEDHIEQCPACQGALERLTGAESPTPVSRPAGSPPDTEASTFLVRLKGRPGLLGAALRRAARGDGGGPDTPSRTSRVGTGLEVEARQTSPARGLPRVPGYEVLGLLGRGGMGVVYKARHQRLGRPVALKMLSPQGEADPEYLERFRTEAEAVARLQHPNIVQIYDIGEVHGEPYLALELLEGGRLTDRTGRAPQPPREAARLTETLARAVHHAHAQGVIHRDLKPSNVLLATDGTPKISDFGVAKRLDVTPEAAPALTSTGSIIGSPGYLAPEQAEPRLTPLGPATDVYALGGILYELLTGRAPFQGATVVETVLQTLNAEPVPPARLQPGVPPDLETVCLKCLEKQPARRYGSAADLAADLARFLAGEPTRARPLSRAARLGKWARRRPAVAALAGLSAFLLLAGLALAGWPWARAEARAAAEARAKDEARTAQAAAEQQRQAAQRQSREVERALARMALERGQDLCQQGEVGSGLLWLARALRLAERAEAGAPEGLPSLQPTIRTNLAAWSPRLVRALGGADHGCIVNAVAFHPDSRAVLVGTWGSPRGKLGPGQAYLWGPDTGKTGPTLDHPQAIVLCVAVSPDGRLALTGSAPFPPRDGQPPAAARLWDRATGRLLGEPLPHPGPVWAVAFSPDGKQFATACADGQVRLWDTATRRPDGQALGHRGAALAVAYSPDGQTLLLGTQTYAALRWDVATRRQAGKPLPHGGPVLAVAWGPGGKLNVPRRPRRPPAGGGEGPALRGRGKPVRRSGFPA